MIQPKLHITELESTVTDPNNRRFSCGDIVIVTNGESDRYSSTGVVVSTELVDGKPLYQVEFNDGGTGWYEPCELGLNEAEDCCVAAPKFKVGDLVKVMSVASCRSGDTGEIIEVECDSGNWYDVKFPGGDTHLYMETSLGLVDGSGQGNQAHEFKPGDLVQVVGRSPWKGLQFNVAGSSSVGLVQCVDDGSYVDFRPEQLMLVRQAPSPESTDETDMVNSPPHYNQGSIETIDGIEVALGPGGFVAYCRGNALKYLWRAAYKGAEAEDLRKAEWYCRKAAEAAEAANED